jgi:hypothetical protein
VAELSKRLPVVLKATRYEKDYGAPLLAEPILCATAREKDRINRQPFVFSNVFVSGQTAEPAREKTRKARKAPSPLHGGTPLCL